MHRFTGLQYQYFETLIDRYRMMFFKVYDNVIAGIEERFKQ